MQNAWIQFRAQFWAQLTIFKLYRAAGSSVNVLISRELTWLRGRDLNPRPLGYEPTRVLARLFCSITYVLLVPWYSLLFGRFCCRNVVGNDPIGGAGAWPLPGIECTLSRRKHTHKEEWGSSSEIEHETIKAIVQAYGEGRINLRKMSKKSHSDQIRYAPFLSSEKVTRPRDHPYTPQTVAEFVGWLKPDGRPQQKDNRPVGTFKQRVLPLLVL